MRLKCFACEVLSRPLYHFAAISPHVVDFTFFQRGLHNTPLDLRKTLQSQIDSVTTPPYDAILLAYGLCGQAILDLHPSQLPLVLPKAHDCITLFLGSRQRYNKEFDRIPGTYWYVQDFIERTNDSTSLLPLGSYAMEFNEELHEEYERKYGKENADYLMETLGGWQKHYQRAAVIDIGLGDTNVVERSAQEQAKKYHWSYEKISGDIGLIRKLVFGEWDDDFLIVDKGKSIQMSYDEHVVKSE